MSRNARHILWSLHVSESETYTHFVVEYGTRYEASTIMREDVILGLDIGLAVTHRGYLLCASKAGRLKNTR